ncbi:DUF6234 family protein [Streptomyces sp. NPDC058662]|uniref:DUF6234 family protein n=1 Tax=Streptomyces sp. NPDC058662 TaxID=3346583 RepID=UPI003663DF24
MTAPTPPEGAQPHDAPRTRDGGAPGASPPARTGRPRAPMRPAADLALAVLTSVLLAAVLLAGLGYHAVEQFGLIAPHQDPGPDWHGLPLGSGVLTFLGALCCACALTVLGFTRRRARISAAVHGAGCALLVALTLTLAHATYEAAHPQTPAPPYRGTYGQCFSGGDSHECPGG